MPAITTQPSHRQTFPKTSMPHMGDVREVPAAGTRQLHIRLPHDCACNRA
jgi:hypothetical protein